MTLDWMRPRQVAGVALVVVLSALPCAAEQPTNGKAGTEFFDHARAYMAFGKDFVGFKEARSSEVLEAEIVSDLVGVAFLAIAICDAGGDLVFIHTLLESEADRKRVGEYLHAQLGYYAKRFDYLITRANRGVAFTRSPGIAVTAGKLKDQLRATQLLFEASRPKP